MIAELRGFVAATVLPAMVFFGGMAHADSYPDRAVDLVTPYAAGGLSDILTRKLAERMTDKLGKAVMVQNRTGGGGVVGMTYTARAQPDGYTLIVTSQGLASVNESLYSDLPYATLQDFEPVSTVAKFSLVMVVNPDSSVDTVDALIAWSKAHPGTLNYGSAGVAATSHLGMEMLKKQTGMDITHIPFKGEAPVLTEIMGGRLDALLATVGGARALIEGGKVKAIGVADVERNALLPDVPTLAESGAPDFNVFGWYALLAPKGTPEAVIEKLSATVSEIVESEDFQQELAERGMSAVSSSPDEAATLIRNEARRWRDVIEQVGITVD